MLCRTEMIYVQKYNCKNINVLITHIIMIFVYTKRWGLNKFKKIDIFIEKWVGYVTTFEYIVLNSPNTCLMPITNN